MYPAVKRVLDFLAATILGLILLPIMLICILLIVLIDRHPPIFAQERIGAGGRPFQIYKLRSMRVSAPNAASAEASQSWITPLGAFLRRSNLDEIPQLICIIKGDMSFIGFRPGLANQEKLNELRTVSGVYEVRPGLSGLAQVNSYDGMPEEEKVEWDSKYVKVISFSTDLNIFFRTFVYLVKRPPVY
jgi:O-antigen biosynthesis protein WbqP